MSAKLESQLLDDALFEQADKFELLKSVNGTSNQQEFRNLAILVAMRSDKNQWSNYSEIANALIRRSGLFPYMNDELESIKDSLAKEIHRSPSGRDYFMHRAQYEVLSKLLSGKSLILSAPTSFGKSFVIDELLLSEKYKNVLIIVPTIALIDETRRRISKLKLPHKLISFTGQQPDENNIFILTQERALDMQNKIYNLDLLVIDEFYKMDSSLGKEEGDRASLLNVSYRIFESKAKQVYLLGPYIKNVSGYIRARNDLEVVIYDDNTTFIEYVHVKERRELALESIIKNDESNILVYCNSTGEIAKAFKLISTFQYDYTADKLNLDFADWLEENICTDWYVTEALKQGIGVHHAQMPRFVSQEMIRRFNNGEIRILLCTSTIIEGVNTSAKSVVIYSNKRGNSSIDSFTFRNIAGRAGRMLRHFSGTVYYFKKPGETDDIVVTDQIGDESDTVEANILNLLDDSALTPNQVSKVKEHISNVSLPRQILKDNYFIPLELQEKVLRNIEEGVYPGLDAIRLARPNSAEQRIIFQALSDLGLNFKSIGRATTDSNGITRVCIFINSYFDGGYAELARALKADRKLSDESIEFAFEFVRNKMSYKLPKYIAALDRLLGLRPHIGTLEPFSATLEFLGQPPTYIQLDELGLPVEISKKLSLNHEDLEAAIAQVKLADSGKLSPFERKVRLDFIESQA